MAMALRGQIRSETVQRLPKGAFAPQGLTGKPECFDCASAGAVLRLKILPGDLDTLDQAFVMARIAVGNDRQEQYRRPGFSMGLVAFGVMRPSRTGDLEEQYAWLETQPWYNALRERWI
jgi:hypothetical protein